MKSARAFAPGNISLLFQVIPDVDPARMGSKGVGFTISKGVVVTVSESRATQVAFNGNRIDLPTVSRVVYNLTARPISVSIQSPLPLGSGFGISGASALATAFAINKLLALGNAPLALAKIAHHAEVMEKTGLGDVINQYFGGCFVKFVTSSKFRAVKIPIELSPIYCISHGKLLTSSILADTVRIQKINAEAATALKKMETLLKKPSVLFADLTSIANTFTKRARLMTPEIDKTIQFIEKRGGHAAQILLGNAVASDIPFPGAMELKMDSKKAKLL